MNRWQRLAPILSAAVAGLLGTVLYRQALGFGFFNDDPTGHFAWMEGRSVLDFFISSAEYGYYRPVVFTVLRLVEIPFGGHDPVANHALLLLLHGANVAMVWLLAYVLSRKSTAFAWVAALLFAAVPFSYEAVIYVASLTHPLFLFWLLLTLLAYSRWRATGHSVWRWLSFLTLIAGLLTHENGVLIFPALVGVEWVVGRPSSVRELLRPVWPYALPGLVFVPLWFAIPKSGDPVALSLANAGGNVVPFLQTLVFPLLTLFQPETLDVAGLLVLVGLTLLITGASAVGSKSLRLWFFSLAWVGISALPSMLFLSPDYLYGSPRLHYVTGVGVGLLWAMPVLWLWVARPYAQLALQENRVTWMGRVLLSLFYVLMIIVPGLPFIQCQVDFYAEATAIVDEMAATAAQAPADQDLVFVNLPFFFSSYAVAPDGCPNPYPWTPVGAVVVPPYARSSDFVRFNGGPDRLVTAVSYDGYQPGWRTSGQVVDAAEMRKIVAGGSTVYVFDLLDRSFAELSANWEPGAANNAESLASFGPGLDLVTSQLKSSESGIPVALTWRVNEVPAEPVTAFVHLYAPDGSLLAQVDLPPGAGHVPQSLWRPGDLLEDAIMLEVDTTTFPAQGLGEYAVKVGLYSALTGERLATEASAQPVQDNAYQIGEILVIE